MHRKIEFIFSLRCFIKGTFTDVAKNNFVNSANNYGVLEVGNSFSNNGNNLEFMEVRNNFFNNGRNFGFTEFENICVENDSKFKFMEFENMIIFYKEGENADDKVIGERICHKKHIQYQLLENPTMIM